MGQLWLFPPPKTLLKKFGADFFHDIPTSPGVYLMCGPDQVLYVGKAKNLRKRIKDYRVANPERMSRRMIRMLNQVTRIHWDICRDEKQAVYREEMLIVALNPKFNRAGNVWAKFV